MHSLGRGTALALLLVAAVLQAHAHSEDHELVQSNITGLDHLGGDFDFLDDDGRLRQLREFRGDPVLVFFGFTNCPDVCPGFMAKAGAVRDRLGDDGDRLRVIFVTVDPERDDRASLQRYLALFGEGFIGARIPAGQLNAVMEQYAVAAQRVRDSDGQIVITHGSGAFLLAPDGSTAAYVSITKAVTEIADLVAAQLE